MRSGSENSSGTDHPRGLPGRGDGAAGDVLRPVVGALRPRPADEDAGRGPGRGHFQPHLGGAAPAGRRRRAQSHRRSARVAYQPPLCQRSSLKRKDVLVLKLRRTEGS